MKIGDYKVKRNYSIPQIVVDIFSVMILIVIWQCFLAFIEETVRYNEILNSRIDDEAAVSGMAVSWVPMIIWIAAAAAIIGISLFLQYKPKKLPRKYRINQKNVQKYSDIYQTAVSCVRIPALLMVFEGLYIHSQIALGSNEWFSLQIILDILLIIIIIQFSKHRVRAVEPKEEEGKREIIAD